MFSRKRIFGDNELKDTNTKFNGSKSYGAFFVQRCFAMKREKKKMKEGVILGLTAFDPFSFNRT